MHTLLLITTAASGYTLIEYPSIASAAMNRMVRNPKLMDGVGGFKIEKEHPLQPFGAGAAIRGYDTLVFERPHQLRMFYAEASPTTSFVCMKNDGTPLIFLNLTVLPRVSSGCMLQVDTTYVRSPHWLAQTLRPIFTALRARV
jgi:hypothetical protein